MVVWVYLRWLWIAGIEVYLKTTPFVENSFSNYSAYSCTLTYLSPCVAHLCVRKSAVKGPNRTSLLPEIRHVTGPGLPARCSPGPYLPQTPPPQLQVPAFSRQAQETAGCAAARTQLEGPRIPRLPLLPAASLLPPGPRPYQLARGTRHAASSSRQCSPAPAAT